jgi:hypothetical protein
VATLTAALALATVSGGFSVHGMTSIFTGALWPVVGMGVALEAGKLSAVAWLGHQRSSGWALKASLTMLVAVLMALNAVGCFGYLSKAHIAHQVDGDVAIAGRGADVEGRISMQAGIAADLDRRIHQIDAAIETATQRGRANAAMQLAADQRRNRVELAAQRDQANKVVAELKVEKSKVDGEKKVAEVDLGPVRYLATLIGAGDQEVLRWFILVVALLLDPAAVLLLHRCDATVIDLGLPRRHCGGGAVTCHSVVQGRNGRQGLAGELDEMELRSRADFAARCKISSISAR